LTAFDLPSRLAMGWERFMEPLQEGRFLAEEGEGFLRTLECHDPPPDKLPYDVVRWIWLIPFTLNWYGKNLPDEVDEDRFRHLEDRFYNEVSRWLGEP
jgi:hypothetical protein